jgi:ectoine hydroxylase-related dioxygenase (phytanoyl-CoA dioxygenase family)
MSMTYVAAAVPDSGEAPIDDWIARFHRDGFLVVQEVLPSELIEVLKDDLDVALRDHPNRGKPGSSLQLRMFETSPANVELFEQEPIVTFAERLIGDDRPGWGPDHVHVVHNNSFRTSPGGSTPWHQDDPPHIRSLNGEPLTNVHLPVMLVTCNYYLTDVTEAEHGPTEFVPGSHLFGGAPPEDMSATPWADETVLALGKAGTALLFNCQVWHRGLENRSDRVRYVTQVSYAHRLIGHRYFPFMNYQMPEHVYRDANPRLKRLLGFLPSGPYG